MGADNDSSFQTAVTMNSRAPMYFDQQVFWEAQAIVMEVRNCSSIAAADVIRKRAATEGQGLNGTARAIVAGGAANFTEMAQV
jgi:hypothetical protein